MLPGRKGIGGGGHSGHYDPETNNNCISLTQVVGGFLALLLLLLQLSFQLGYLQEELVVVR